MQTSRVYSRRWTIENRPTDPTLATAFSVLVTIDEPQLTTWLRKSGMTQPPVFVQIKKQDDQTDASDQYRIIWLGKQMVDAITKTNSLEHHAGMILKPPMSYGARVHVDHFEESWKAIKGDDEPIPKSVEVKFKYMISNLPANIKSQEVESWTKQIPWNCRVLRKFNNGSFLIGSAGAVPNLHLSLNGCTVLVTDFVESKKEPGNIVAGKLQTSNNAATRGAPEGEDPWMGQSIGKPNQPASTVTNAWAHYKPSANAREAQAASSNQEQRIQTIESEMKQLRDQVKNHHTENQAKIQQLDSRIGGIQDSLQQSLRDALQEQSTSLIATFEALIRSPSNGSKEGKEPKTRERSRSGGRAP